MHTYLYLISVHFSFSPQSYTVVLQKSTKPQSRNYCEIRVHMWTFRLESLFFIFLKLLTSAFDKMNHGPFRLRGETLTFRNSLLVSVHVREQSFTLCPLIAIFFSAHQPGAGVRKSLFFLVKKWLSVETQCTSPNTAHMSCWHAHLDFFNGCINRKHFSKLLSLYWGKFCRVRPGRRPSNTAYTIQLWPFSLLSVICLTHRT